MKYQNVSNRQTELYDNVCYVEFQIICLTETLLNGICFDHAQYPISLTNVRSDTVSSTKCSAAVPTTVLSAVGNFIGMICSFMTNGLGRNFHPK